MNGRREDKVCASCGRRFAYRSKWARDWDQRRYCSQACRRDRLDQRDQELERRILDLLAQVKAHGSICPSQAAQIRFGDDWRTEMERVRRAARRLVERGLIDICQRGVVVDPSEFKGPIRLRLRR